MLLNVCALHSQVILKNEEHPKEQISAGISLAKFHNSIKRGQTLYGVNCKIELCYSANSSKYYFRKVCYIKILS